MILLYCILSSALFAVFAVAGYFEERGFHPLVVVFGIFAAAGAGSAWGLLS
jgi:hypothetical protein